MGRVTHPGVHSVLNELKSKLEISNDPNSLEYFTFLKYFKLYHQCQEYLRTMAKGNFIIEPHFDVKCYLQQFLIIVTHPEYRFSDLEICIKNENMSEEDFKNLVQYINKNNQITSISIWWKRKRDCAVCFIRALNTIPILEKIKFVFCNDQLISEEVNALTDLCNRENKIKEMEIRFNLYIKQIDFTLVSNMLVSRHCHLEKLCLFGVAPTSVSRTKWMQALTDSSLVFLDVTSNKVHVNRIFSWCKGFFKFLK